MIRATLLTLALTLPATADDRRGPDDSFFEGNYDLVGRSIGDAARTYAGRATLTAKDGKLMVARCIEGETTRGHLTYKEWGSDRLIFLTGEFAAQTAATCEFAVDNNNYARLACTLYRPDDPNIDPPGLEFLIAADKALPDMPEVCE